jgi:16S rRNA (cytosine967-C5)-methyltransferase
VFRAEGQHQVDAFLQRTADARSVDAPGHLTGVADNPAQDGAGARAAGDGFFYARLDKLS